MRMREAAREAGIETDLEKASKAAADILAGVELEIQDIGHYVGLLRSKYGNKTFNDLIAEIERKGLKGEQKKEKIKALGKDVFETLSKMLSRIIFLIRNDIRQERQLTRMFDRTTKHGKRNASIMEDIYSKEEAILKEISGLLKKLENVATTGRPHRYWWGWGKLGDKSLGYILESIKSHEMNVLVEADAVCRKLEKAGKIVGKPRLR